MTEEFHSFSKRLIEQRIQNLILELKDFPEFSMNNIDDLLNRYDFVFRSKKYPNECPCYDLGEGKRCHSTSDLNCFFCYCPYYKKTCLEGGCLIGNPLRKGEWFFDENLPTGKIWDCSKCEYPHKKEFIKRQLIDFFKKNSHDSEDIEFKFRQLFGLESVEKVYS